MVLSNRPDLRLQLCPISGRPMNPGLHMQSEICVEPDCFVIEFAEQGLQGSGDEYVLYVPCGQTEEKITIYLVKFWIICAKLDERYIKGFASAAK